MREILFMGKTYGGEWVYGDLNHYVKGNNDDVFIRDIAFKYDVIPETIGQYTNLKDKNGTKIFEGHIVLLGFTPCIVRYDIDNARYMLYEYGKFPRNGFNKDTMKLAEVIGYVYDNPELLEVE